MTAGEREMVCKQRSRRDTVIRLWEQKGKLLSIMSLGPLSEGEKEPEA